MSYQVLARKWRPKSFSTLVGQEAAVRALSNALAQQRLHHAYLFTGTRGVGKTTLARILAKALNCETGVTAEPCGQCAACQQIDAGRFVDLIELDAASNTGVDNIREVLDNARYAPTTGRFKVYIIDEVHMLSKSAFNAMLKTLEEPPGHVKFILATTDPQKVPVTVLSRCLQFNLRPMTPTLVANHLAEVLAAEGIPSDTDALKLLGHAANGSMRDALSLLDQAIAYGSGEVKNDIVRSMLGSFDRDFLAGLINPLLAQDGAALMAQAAQLEQQGQDPDGVLSALAEFFHQVALMQAVPEAVADELPERELVATAAGQWGAEDVQLYYQIVLHGRRDLPLAPDPAAGFRMTLLRLLAFRPQTAVAMPAPSGPARTQPPAPRPASAAPQSAPPPAAPKAERPAPVQAAPAVERVAASVPPVAAAVATEPAPAEAPTAEPVAADTAASRFDGDWPALIRRLRISGTAGMLANEAELIGWQDGEFDLRVPEDKPHLTSRMVMDKLKDALQSHFGHAVVLKVQQGAGRGQSVAAQNQQARAERQRAAEEAAHADPFVIALTREFDASIIDIKPL